VQQEVQEGHKEAQKVLLQRIQSLEASIHVASEASLHTHNETMELRAKLFEKDLECSDLQVHLTHVCP
jgi:hypothetical protein